ncbi:hypothetical protein P7K49_009648 [Saguinus oedipus]|uniref:C2 domain-containing protein n=1 Tax=Saguinus oedipus TaxID=9490 RepID=A0ABQ9VKY7_SAGOE|nr:hypothetical protein P7K49_009648 [Saguinus oedipus]
MDPGVAVGNLLLPRGVSAERPWARLRVRLYRAEGLPALRSGLLGSLARALRDQRVLVEPYVRVSFLAQQGETSVRAEAAAPEWNEQLSFVELLPPLTRSLRLQLRDDAPLVDAALATHVLDLRRISHPGRAGEPFWPRQTRPHSPRSNRAEVWSARKTNCFKAPPDCEPYPQFGSVGKILTTATCPVTSPVRRSYCCARADTACPLLSRDPQAARNSRSLAPSPSPPQSIQTLPQSQPRPSQSRLYLQGSGSVPRALAPAVSNALGR